MNSIIFNFVLHIITVFALVFFVSRVALAQPLNTIYQTCTNAAQQVQKLNCRQLGKLSNQVKAYGEIPPDGPVCEQATETYDKLTDLFYQCSGAGTSEQGSCFSLCREAIAKIKKNEFDEAAKLKRSPAYTTLINKKTKELSNKATLCYDISKVAQKVRFSDIKAPSCNYATEKPADEYIELRHEKPVQNNKPNFRPIEEVETKQ